MLGIPNTEPTGTGEFLGRIQFNAMTGFWETVKRVQDSTGNWGDQKSDPFRDPAPSFLADVLSLEVGYIKFASPPSFLVVPYGTTLPPQPDEMQTDATGKQRKSFLAGFRIKIMSPRTFGDSAAYYFAHNSKNVLQAMDDLHTAYSGAPEAAQGLLPIVQVTRIGTIEQDNRFGKKRFFAPVFSITGWAPRPEAFGAATVALPKLSNATPVQAPRPAPVTYQQPAPAAYVAPAVHVPPVASVAAAAIAPDAMPF